MARSPRRGAAMTSAGPYTTGELSFWYRDLDTFDRRPALRGDRSVDIAIVGAGYTGLWTAYYLALADPSLRIAVLEREFAGFGASGRNGGWLSGVLVGSAARYATTHGRDAVVALRRAMYSGIDEVIAVAAREGIDADIVKGGLLKVARSSPQVERLHTSVAADREWGSTEDDIRILSGSELAGRINVAGAVVGAWSPHCARIQPAKLVRGLAAAVERRGVAIYEDSPVCAIEPGRVRTALGTVTARHILRATEGYTAGLPGERRTWLPMNSSMIVTAPLPTSAWAQIGWDGQELLGDMAHAFMYAQRTADGRIAFGGRGVPYRYRSRWDANGQTAERTVTSLRELLGTFFPAASHTRIEHAWSGVLGVPRDWCATVQYDPRTGLGLAGGYAGHGVTTSNLAGRTVADLVLERDTELTRLPWVGHTVRRWEPEPLRWLGVRGMYAAYRLADRIEYRYGNRTSRIARLADRVCGR